jgi:hypothetical protein
MSNNNREGLPIEAAAAIVSIIAMVWGIAMGLSWIIGLITN